MGCYQKFLEQKIHLEAMHGFYPDTMPDALFPFQRSLTEWALKKGRGALFEDCGLGKTLQELVWAENVSRKENGRVLILTPLAVSHQFVSEGEKFGIECRRAHSGDLFNGITVTNYERLHLHNPNDYVGVVCDESSILKNFDGKRKADITNFMLKMPYRLLATATAAPNDYIELGTSSEALGELGHMDMLNRFFKNDQNNSKVGRHYGQQMKWRFKGHAETQFWRWVCSWARAIRRPSDLGFDDSGFVLPPLIEREHLVKVDSVPEGMLFNLPAVGLKEQRAERRRSINERCEKVAELVNDTGEPALVWCHLNTEGDLLESIIPDSDQVSGLDSDDDKEAKLLSFARGNTRVLVTKPKIGAFGLNFQHCGHITFFPSHSYEQYYQGVRRCWRFGRKGPVKVDVVTTEGEINILKNLQKKASKADEMFANLVHHMNDAIGISKENKFIKREDIPAWLS